MEHRELISIIIPMYKVEKYLEKCIQSVVDQTYENLEIILVDDGSPDRCPEICDEWAKKDERIKVIHKENGGISDARNAGLAAATGAYIGFVDSDDYIETNMYEILFEALKKENAAIAMCDCEIVSEDGQVIESKSPIVNEVFTGIQGLHKLADNDGWYYVTLWNKLCARKVLEGLKFPQGRVYEDEEIVHEVFFRADKIVSLNQKLYNYVQRKGSITKSTSGIKSLDIIEPLCHRLLFYKEHGLTELCSELCRNLRAVYDNRRMQIYGIDDFQGRKRLKEVDKLFKATYFECAKSVSRRDKFKYEFPSIWFALCRMKIKLKK